MTGVCLIEDQTLVREGHESLLHLTEDIRVIAHASDGYAALEVIESTRPDVILLDLRMDGLAWKFEVVVQIIWRLHAPTLRCIVVAQAA